MVNTRSRSRAEPLRIDGKSPFTLDYHTEGAANIVYELTKTNSILPSDEKDFEAPGRRQRQKEQPLIDARFKGKLLRLRKAKPASLPVQESQAFFKAKIEPLFPRGILVDQVLCEIAPEVMEKCNVQLRKDEKQKFLRDEGREGTYLDEIETYGTLVTDMLCDEEHASCSFKPKWLLQSPSAPAGSKRCRNCALRAMRKSKADDDSEIGSFCPLSLVSNDADVLAGHLDGAMCNMRGEPISMPEQISYAVPFLLKSPILPLLRGLQERFDAVGPMEADVQSEEFRIAMTLRDCSLLMKVSAAQSPSPP